MPRIRNVKPETFDDPDLNTLPFAARYLFIGLWTQADRDGRLEDDPRRIKVRLLPYDDVDCEGLLDALDGRFITRYAVDGAKFIQINNFAKHQRFHKDEKPSTFPGVECRTDATAGRKTGKPGKVPADHGTLPAKSPESGILKSDSGDPDPVPTAPEGFAEFQSRYPRGPHVGTFSHALKVWKKLPAADRAACLAALPFQSTSERFTKEGGQFVPTPQKYLSERYWERDYAPAQSSIRPPSDAEAFGWCDHEPRCGTRAGHELKCQRELLLMGASA